MKVLKYIESAENKGEKIPIYYKGKKLKRFNFIWKYGYVIAHNKKEAMDILKEDHQSWFVEPHWIKPHEDLTLTKTEKATKKDVDDYAEYYDIHIGSIGYERDNKV